MLWQAFHRFGECVAAPRQGPELLSRSLQQDNASNRAVLLTCSYLKGELDHHKEFPTWLESVFGSLHCEVTYPEVLEALREFHRKGARLMTTNYDELLEHYCGLTIITIPGHLESEMVFTEATTSTF
jgi:hypothetical protein